MVDLSASQEDYLEAILHIVTEKGAARPKEISKRLKVTYSSVTKALHTLSKKQLVNYEPYGLVSLTPSGKRYANSVVYRHRAFRDFLTKVLFIDEAEADELACKLEHAVPKSVVERMIKFVEYVDACPYSRIEWLEGFGFRCKNSSPNRNCPCCDQAHPPKAKSQKRKKRS